MLKPGPPDLPCWRQQFRKIDSCSRPWPSGSSGVPSSSLTGAGEPCFANAGRAPGVGISAEEFSPIALPNLKHLWSDLRSGGGYGLLIRCDWHVDRVARRRAVIWRLRSRLRTTVSSSGATSSNLTAGEMIPRMAYLPPFAGIGAREERMSSGRSAAIDWARPRRSGAAQSDLRLLETKWRRTSAHQEAERSNPKAGSGRPSQDRCLGTASSRAGRSVQDRAQGSAIRRGLPDGDRGSGLGRTAHRRTAQEAWPAAWKRT